MNMENKETIKTKSPESAPAIGNETFKVGLVGCGHISGAHLKGWEKTSVCRVHGVLDYNRALAEKQARAFRVPHIYDDLAALIEDCDVIDVCTPPQTHFQIARDVLKANRHLVIEKPLVTDVSEWDELQKLAQQSAKTITVIHNLKYMHGVQLAKRWVDGGRIGDIIGITRQFLTNPETDRMLVGNTHWSHKLPGGRWFETLPHELYLIHYFVGALDLAHVSALHTGNAPPGAPADEVLITLRDDRRHATIHYSANCRINRRAFILHGSRGTIEIDILSDAVTISTAEDGQMKRAVGRMFFDAGATLLKGVPDRMGYALRRIQVITPHVRLIQAVDRYLQKTTKDAPTPLDEIDYVVRNCDRIGREIDRQVAPRLAAFAEA